MAEFTDALAARVNRMLDAFEGGQTIGELDPATKAVRDLRIEVVDDTNGKSGSLPLTEAIYSATNAVCGRYWNRKQGTYKAAGYYGSLDMLRNLPNILGLGCYLVTDDRTMRKLDPDNHNRFADGSPARLDGSMGQYMWCWRKHYYAWWVEGDNYIEAVSLNPIKGRYNYTIPVGGTSALGAGVIDRTNSILCSVVSDDPQFRGGNNQVDTWDNTYRTMLGRVATNRNMESFGSMARKRGEGWESGWFIPNRVVEYLCRIILGTRHIQDSVNSARDSNGLYQGGLGIGVTNVGNWWGNNFGYYPFVPTSFGVDKGDFLGEIPYEVKGEDGSTLQTVNVPCFFGLKNFYGHIGHIERGTLMNRLPDGTAEYYVTPSLYGGFSLDLEGKIKAAVLPAVNTTQWHYISELSMQNLCGCPTSFGASSVTGYCDGCYNNLDTSGLRAVFRRGIAYHGAYAGLACLHADVGLSNAHVSWSSPLCFACEDPSPVPKLY